MKSKHSKKEQIAYLFDEIGRIDDRLVQEAAFYRSERRSYGWIKGLTLAACLLLCCVLLFRVFLFESVKKGESEPNDMEVEISSLDLYLTKNENLRYTMLSSEGELDFFGNTACLVWQEEGSDSLYVSRSLSTRELEALSHRISQGAEVGEESPYLNYRVWILCGDGRVLTPYLEASPGNIGYGALFDYNAELIPSSSFTSYVSEILEGQ